ncbi:hypothetical protein [Herbiconiux daphne]|uniref:Uncharacterized protein n=1 Tax=Herbiconiux daphne TaxID=2970914 RepID=A0ABT2H7A6_9MICO|nr:hypothetical protein [Herbiconiux daphne]MCS5735758.1 hypothetical protein [Herbiconiux daphne]
MSDQVELDWRSEFTVGDLATLRSAIPQAIQASQERSARAHTAYADPDGEHDVYGVGMARGAQKELLSLIKGLDSYDERRVPGTRRTLTYVGDALIFLQRVGKKMPKNHRRLRLSYLPEQRRDMFAEASNTKYVEPGGLFEMPAQPQGDDDVARLSDVLGMIEAGGRHITLFVPYYSSTPFTVGSMYWAPARLRGRYFEFTDPERLDYVKAPVTRPMKDTKPKPVGGFADGSRPRTKTALRPRPEDGEGQK